MSKPANKAAGEVALNQAGEGICLKFTVDALERLESEFGPDYLDVIVLGLQKVRMPVYRACVAVAVSGEGASDAAGLMPWGASFEKLQSQILDALYLAISGRTFEEQQRHEDEMYKKRLEEAESNPRVAAALMGLFSKERGEQDAEPGSNPTK